jgi:hypothetical protein
MKQVVKTASANIQYYLSIQSTFNVGSFYSQKSIKLEGGLAQEATGFSYNVELEQDKKPKETLEDTSAQELRGGFTFFSDLVDDVEESAPLSMEADCSFGFRVKTKNLPGNLWRTAARNTVYAREMSGRLKLFQLSPSVSYSAALRI